MSGDLSLTQALGGLRIANPDDSTTSPSPPAPDVSPIEPPPLSSSHSSASTVTSPLQRQASHPQIQYSYSSSGGFPSPLEEEPPSLSPGQVDAQPSSGRLSHRQSMPLAHHAQQQLQYPSPPHNIIPQPRQYPPSAARPISDIYNHPNASSTSQGSSYSAYRYGDEPPQPAPIPIIQRSTSRAAAAGYAPASHLSRDGSRSERHMHGPVGMNGPIPPRRGSRRIQGHGAGMGPPASQGSGSPYGVEGGPLPSSEEWKEKGAAVGIRQEIDANGNKVQKVMKKGVKDFNFGRTLGEGSYSTVLAASDRQTLREYAIKVLDKRHIIREKKVKYVNIEKDTLNRLTDHPGIVRLYYTFQDERSLYFVLDLASNGELLGVLKKTGTFDEECAQFYSAQILDSIEYIHSRGVIHRDLKPENVLLDGHMHVKITDFGTAKILDIPSKQNGMGSAAGDPMDGAETDRAMSFVGTAEYVSPELLTDKNACKASDLWAFGCIVFQLLAGRPPFKAGNEYQTFQKIVALDYSFPEGFPPVARDLVERLLVLDPAKRLPMEHIKNHQFFDGIVWGKGLWKSKAPRLKPYVVPAQAPIQLNAPGSTPPIVTPSSQAKSHARMITELPPPSQLDIDWSPVLTRDNERILKLGNLIVTSSAQPHSPNSKGLEQTAESSKKFSRFFGGNTTKKRQRLVMVTSSARLIIAAAGGEEKKAKMDISLLAQDTQWRGIRNSQGTTSWCLDTRDKHLLFEDPNATPSDPDGSRYCTEEWLEMLDKARELAHAYPSESGYAGFSSSVSNSTSTIDADVIEGVNIPTGGARLRKEMAGDNESLKGRKRFSKRHSKNGLAAVF